MRIMKKTKKLLIFAGVAAVCAAMSLGCADRRAPEFELAEYTVSSGERVTIGRGGLSYTLLSAPDGVTVSADGTFTIADGVENGTQVVLAAVGKDGAIVSTAVCTIKASVATPEVAFTGSAKYIVDGDKVTASAGQYGVSYALKTAVDGITVNPSSGRVTYTQIVADGTPFTVVASSHGASAEREYLAAVGELIVVKNPVEFAELGVGRDVSFEIDYGDMSGSGAAFAEQGVLGVELVKSEVSSDGYVYDKDEHVLTIKKELIAKLSAGENELRILTAKNAAVATIKAATYVRTAEDLAAIGESKAALAGYYVLANDIDLSDYLKDKKGGWTPIGEYCEDDKGVVIISDYFTGTIDGLGHKITGLWIDWVSGCDKSTSDDPDHAPVIDYDKVYRYFNAGLVAYMSADGVLRNIVLESAVDDASYVCSYSGGLVGTNYGTVENCSVNVKVLMDVDDDSLRVAAGGLVGNNMGDIRNCISLGWVAASAKYGAFCGINNGRIENCYAVDDPSLNDKAELVRADRPTTLNFCGIGGGTNCAVYGSKAELIEKADFSAWTDWSGEPSELPAPIVTEIK